MMRRFEVKNNPELSKAIQLRALELGYVWAIVGKVVANTEYPYIFLNTKVKLIFRRGLDNVFDADVEGAVESTLADLYPVKTHKVRTHTITLNNRSVFEVSDEVLNKIVEICENAE